MKTRGQAILFQIRSLNRDVGQLNSISSPPGKSTNLHYKPFQVLIKKKQEARSRYQEPKSISRSKPGGETKWPNQKRSLAHPGNVGMASFFQMRKMTDLVATTKLRSKPKTESPLATHSAPSVFRVVVGPVGSWEKPLKQEHLSEIGAAFSSFPSGLHNGLRTAPSRHFPDEP